MLVWRAFDALTCKFGSRLGELLDGGQVLLLQRLAGNRGYRDRYVLHPFFFGASGR